MKIVCKCGNVQELMGNGRDEENINVTAYKNDGTHIHADILSKCKTIISCTRCFTEIYLNV